MRLSRRASLALPLLLAACGGDGPPRSFPPLRYDYLTRLQLNVASIAYAPLPPPGPLDSTAPAPPGPALEQLARDRLIAAGSTGQALVTVQDAHLTRTGNSLDGTLAIRLDITAPDGTTSGFAEARVTRNLTGFGSNLRAALYDITKQLLGDMNVEFEYQLRRSLRDYLEPTGAAPTPGPVQQQDLPSPRALR